MNVYSSSGEIGPKHLAFDDRLLTAETHMPVLVFRYNSALAQQRRATVDPDGKSLSDEECVDEMCRNVVSETCPQANTLFTTRSIDALRVQQTSSQGSARTSVINQIADMLGVGTQVSVAILCLLQLANRMSL